MSNGTDFIATTNQLDSTLNVNAMAFDDIDTQPTTVNNLNGKICSFLLQTYSQKLKHPSKHAKVYIVEEDCLLRDKLL